MSSIGPVFPPAIPSQLQQQEELQAAQQRQAAEANRIAAEQVAQTNQGNSQNQQNLKVKNDTPLPQIPEDEVKVQWDTPMTDRIEIYQFVNQQSGSLIIQVPSEEVLGLAHDIQSELAQDASRETAAAEAAGKGGKNNGD